MSSKLTVGIDVAGKALTATKRFPEESDLLAAVRDVHLRLKTLMERPDLAEFVSETPEVIKELAAAERMLYMLRAGVALEDRTQEGVSV